MEYKSFKSNKKYTTISLLVGALTIFGGLISWGYFVNTAKNNETIIDSKIDQSSEINTSPTVSPIPESYIIPHTKHVIQTFNNCGPATLSMALSYFGIDKSQKELGDKLRPYQVAGGDNDDKSVTLTEVALEAEENGLHSYLRPNGTPEKLEKIIAIGVPVITRTWLGVNEDIGHYRVIRGYDKNTQELIQDDSLQGKDLRYTYSEFDDIWKQFNYEYLVIVDDARQDEVEMILGEEIDEGIAWSNALDRINEELTSDPDNIHLTFAKSRIYFYLGQYENSIIEFEKVEDRLSFRTLWYQIEPIRAYSVLGDRNRVFELSDKILSNENRAFSELYILRGEFYEKEGNIESARDEYQKAVMYNVNMSDARVALARVQ